MKAKDIRNLTEDQINKKIADLKEELFNLKFQAALGNIEPVARHHNCAGTYSLFTETTTQ